MNFVLPWELKSRPSRCCIFWLAIASTCDIFCTLKVWNTNVNLYPRVNLSQNYTVRDYLLPVDLVTSFAFHNILCLVVGMVLLGLLFSNKSVSVLYYLLVLEHLILWHPVECGYVCTYHSSSFVSWTWHKSKKWPRALKSFKKGKFCTHQK